MDQNQINQIIAEKLNQGLKLNEIQKLLELEHDVRMTYLELRMLAAELEVDWSRQEPAKPEPDPDDVVDPEAEEAEDAPEDIPGQVRVTVSKIARPDAAVSGSYACPSGARGEWIVDHYGRPGLIPAENSPKPTEDEMQAFQAALVKELQGGGL